MLPTFTPFVYQAPVIEFLSSPALSSLQIQPLLPLPGDKRFEKLWKNTLKALIQTWAETHALPNPETLCCHFAKHLIDSIARILYVPRSPEKEPRQLEWSALKNVLTTMGRIRSSFEGLQSSLLDGSSDSDDNRETAPPSFLERLGTWERALTPMPSAWMALEEACLAGSMDRFTEALNTFTDSLDLIPRPSEPRNPSSPLYPSSTTLRMLRHMRQEQLIKDLNTLNKECIEPLWILKQGLADLPQLKARLNLYTRPLSSPVTVRCQSAASCGLRTCMEDTHFLIDATDVCATSVFDGHGGRHVALQAKAYFESHLLELLNSCGGSVPNAIEKAIYEFQQRLPVDMNGSTASFCIIDKRTSLAYVAVLGDSEVRAYVPTSDGFLDEVPLSCVRDWSNEKDARRAIQYHSHTSPNKPPLSLETYLGLFRNHKKPRFPHDSHQGINVSRSLGDQGFGKIGELPAISQKAKIGVYGLKSGCTIVIGTDGLWDFVTSEVIKGLIQSGSEKVAQELCQEALNHRSSDNITVAVIWCL